MSEASRDILGEDRFAAGGLRMAALSLLMEHSLHREGRAEREAAARERVGRDMTSVLDGLFGGQGEHAPAGIGGVAAGLDGLVHALRGHGLGREVDSWIGPGPNLPVTAEQVSPVFDAAAVERQAQRAGTDRESLLREIAIVLPQFVDRMSPAGRLPSDPQDLQHVTLAGLRGLAAER